MRFGAPQQASCGQLRLADLECADTSALWFDATGWRRSPRIASRKALAADALPGVKPATITDLQTAADNFKNGLGAQSGGKGDTSKAFKALDAKIAEVAKSRRDIQYAADNLWPAGVPANAPIRSEFKLPPDRSLK